MAIRLSGVLTVLGVMLVWSAGVKAQPAGIEGNVTVVNDATDPVPVAVQGNVPVIVEGNVSTTERVPVAASGVWTQAGLQLPPMILHDLIIYFDAQQGEPASCTSFVNFVIDQFNSRPLHRATLDAFESVEFHYEAGIDTSNLRFGTGFGVTCTRNWAAMGFTTE